MRRKESIRQIGNVTVRRNKQLGFTHYKVGGAESGVPIQIYISDEMKNHPELSFKRLRQLASAEIERVMKDPYGETSIDSQVSDPALRNKRAVNRVSDGTEAEIGLPIAIKSSSRESLTAQYKVMRDLQKTAERRLGGLEPIIEFLPVYGAIGIGDRQFLIMKYVKDAKEIEDKEIAFTSHGWMAAGEPDKELAFSANEHQALVNALDIEPAGSMVRWRTVAGEISDRLGKQLGDLAGRNVLTSSHMQGVRYTIIDQVPVGTYI
jgi:hypothetical protein